MKVLQWAYIEFEELWGLCPDAGTLRRWVNAAFPNNPLLHQHEPGSSRPVFQYPMVQYKIIEDLPVLYGIEDGAEQVEYIHNQIREQEVRLGSLIIGRITLREGKSALKESAPSRYKFLTPWLAFNRDNYARFRETKNWAQRKVLINSILAGNILSMAKTFGIMVDFPLELRTRVDLLKVRIPRHNLSAHGLVGTFEANLELPPLLGLGNHASLGFGTVNKEEIEIGPGG